MPLSINSLDDEPVIDETPVFNAGQISNSRPANIPQNGAFLLENCEISTIGRLITRRGTDRLGDAFDNPVYGIAYYSTPASQHLLAFVDDGDGFLTIKLWNGSAWIDAGSAGAPVGHYAALPFNIVQGYNATQGAPTIYIAQSGQLAAYYNNAGALTTIPGTALTNPRFCEWHTERLILACGDNNPQGLSPSFFLDGTIYDSVNWDFNVGKGDGDNITGIKSWTNSNLFVGKQHSIWVVNMDPTLLLGDLTLNSSAFTVNQVHKQIGLAAANTACQVGADLIWLSDSGVRSLIRTQSSDSQSEVGPALSDPVDDIIQRINPAAIQFSSAYYWRNKYVIGLPLDSAMAPSHTLVWNNLTQTWSGFWTGWQPLCWTRWIDGDTAKLVFGQADGSITNFLDFVDEGSEVEGDFEDQGVAYPTNIESRAFTCGDQDSPKTGLFTRLEFKESQGDVTVSAILGRNTTGIDLAPEFTTGESLTLPFTIPTSLPGGGYVSRSLDLMSVGQWREVRIKVHSDAHKIALNKISVGAFLDSFTIQQ